MSILIKNMEMPTDNTVLLRIYPQNDGVFYVEQLDIDDDILDKYWAVPVPPHGRLIDADALNYTMLYKENWMSGTGVEAPAVWKKDIDTSPTIIEAEESEQ